MKTTIKDLFKRNIAIVILFVIGLILPSFVGKMSVGFKTIFLIIAFESIALFLSNIAYYVYTYIDFGEVKDNVVLARVFLGVHILVGLSVYSVYMLEGINASVLP